MLSVLYSAIGFIGICAYLPQILKIIRTDGRCEDLSLQSWSIWFASSLITTLYAALQVKDTLYASMSGANCFFVTLTMSLILWRRFSYLLPQITVQPAFAYARVKFVFVLCAISSLSLLTYLR
ncbi:MAG: PQ-loop domain-containing transporter [Pseudobdellovibrionaceae bacterium]